MSATVECVTGPAAHDGGETVTRHRRTTVAVVSALVGASAIVVFSIMVLGVGSDTNAGFGGVIAGLGGPTGGVGGGAVGGPASIGDPMSGGCDPELVGDEDGPVTSVYTIEDGRLAGLCWGVPDETVTGAFAVLAVVAPPGGLADVSFVAGFDGGGDTVAFVVPVDDAYSGFVMAFDTVAADADPAELRLTVVHEYAHVFTQRVDQLDVTVDRSSCPTFWNGAGCVVAGSYLDTWINEFWSEEELRSLPVDGSIDEEGGYERCLVDPGFLGAYAASHPEEDFAEAYSAFVFALDVPPGVESRMRFFEAIPEFVDVRNRVAAAGFPPVRNLFDVCG